MRFPLSEKTLTPTPAPAVGYSGAGFFVVIRCSVACIRLWLDGTNTATAPIAADRIANQKLELGSS